MLVKGWMTSDVITIDEDTSMMKASQIMKENNVRRLPVMHKGKLIGMVTDRDIKEASPSKATT
jgi:acetoin utilization protein AcuB